MSRGLQTAHAALTLALLGAVGWLVATRPAGTEGDLASLRDEVRSLQEQSEKQAYAERQALARAESAERKARMLTETLAAERAETRPPPRGDPRLHDDRHESAEDLSPEERAQRDAQRAAAAAAAATAAADMEKRTADLTAVMSSLGARVKGLILRQLQPHERWDKAREVMGLNDVQIDEIRSALEERDAAYEDATTTEHVDTDTGPEIHTEVDERAVEDADRRYAERVDRTLTEEQRKTWRDEGFSQAFGKVRPRDRQQPDRGLPR